MNPLRRDYQGWRSLPYWQRGAFGIAIMVVLTPVFWMVDSLFEGTPFPPAWGGQATMGMLFGAAAALMALLGVDVLVRTIKK